MAEANKKTAYQLISGFVYTLIIIFILPAYPPRNYRNG